MQFFRQRHEHLDRGEAGGSGRSHADFFAGALTAGPDGILVVRNTTSHRRFTLLEPALNASVSVTGPESRGCIRGRHSVRRTNHEVELAPSKMMDDHSKR